MNRTHLARLVFALAIVCTINLSAAASTISVTFTGDLWAPADGRPVYTVGNIEAKAVNPFGSTTDLSQGPVRGLGIISADDPDQGIKGEEVLGLQLLNGGLFLYGFVAHFQDWDLPGAGYFRLDGGPQVLFSGPDPSAPGTGEVTVLFAAPVNVFYMDIGATFGSLRNFTVTRLLDEAPQVSQVPEPGSMILLGTGLCAILYRLRRKTRA
jgi:hypothetical protein